jgi:hypothetical protein
MRLGGREPASPMRRCDMSLRYGVARGFRIDAGDGGWLFGAGARWGSRRRNFIASGRCIQEMMHSCASNAISRALRGAAF